MAERQAVLIAGPTASGKTQAAIAAARRLGAVVVNADSMQVYAGLDILSAAPGPAEHAAAPHVLFGHVDPARRYSTGAWLADVAAVIQVAEKQNQPLAFVGGTGLYFEALINGFAEIPAIAAEVIQEVEAEITGLDEPGRRALLMQHDPETARMLKVADPQRVVRALSVLRATGRNLSAYHGTTATPLLAGYVLERLVLLPERAVLRQRIADRFALMLAEGAVDEVKALLARGLDPSLPAMKAIGVPEIAAHLAGTISLDEAASRAITASRQYAKRQSTWLRGRMADWPVVDPLA